MIDFPQSLERLPEGLMGSECNVYGCSLLAQLVCLDCGFCFCGFHAGKRITPIQGIHIPGGHICLTEHIERIRDQHG